MTSPVPPRSVAAAPRWVRDLLTGTERQARVVHRGADAVYTEAGGLCLGVLSTAAAAVPCGLRTTLPVLSEDLTDARTARWGGGRLLLGGTQVVVTRTVDAQVPQLPADRVAGAIGRLTPAVGSRLEAVVAELPPDALDALARGRAEAVPALLGRGSGLTPVGDDVLAGWLATAVAASTDSAADPAGDRHAVADAVAVGARATTTLSATLLSCAARGDVLPQFRRLLQDLAAADQPDPGPAVDALLRVGHTSGAGLVLGTLLALRHLHAHPPHRSRLTPWSPR